MKYYTLVITLLLSIPYLFDLVGNGGSNFNEILNDFLIQILNGFILFRACSLHQQARHSSLIKEDKSVAVVPKKSQLVQMFLNLFKEKEHQTV